MIVSMGKQKLMLIFIEITASGKVVQQQKIEKVFYNLPSVPKITQSGMLITYIPSEL